MGDGGRSRVERQNPEDDGEDQDEGADERPELLLLRVVEILVDFDELGDGLARRLDRVAHHEPDEGGGGERPQLPVIPLLVGLKTAANFGHDGCLRCAFVRLILRLPRRENGEQDAADAGEETDERPAQDEAQRGADEDEESRGQAAGERHRVVEVVEAD